MQSWWVQETSFKTLKISYWAKTFQMVEYILLCNSCFSLSYKSDRTLTFSPADIITVHSNHVLEERAEGSDWIKQIKSSEGNSNQQCLWQVCQEAVSIIHVRLALCCWIWIHCQGNTSKQVKCHDFCFSPKINQLHKTDFQSLWWVLK